MTNRLGSSRNHPEALEHPKLWMESWISSSWVFEVIEVTFDYWKEEVHNSWGKTHREGISILPQIYPSWWPTSYKYIKKNEFVKNVKRNLAVLLCSEAISGIPDYLKDHLSYIASTQPTRMGRQGMLSIRNVYLVGPWKRASQRNIIPPRYDWLSAVLLFRKALKTCFFQFAWGPWRMVDLIMLLLPWGGGGMGFYVVEC